jgi:hypothetical protein
LHSTLISNIYLRLYLLIIRTFNVEQFHAQWVTNETTHESNEKHDAKWKAQRHGPHDLSGFQVQHHQTLGGSPFMDDFLENATNESFIDHSIFQLDIMANVSMMDS